jgi:hypothetical protein
MRTPAPAPESGGQTAADDWSQDQVRLASGVVVPVRATARRRGWETLPHPVQAAIEVAAGSPVSAASTVGTGFTAGFASRLDLVDGSSIFVKAASAADDRRSNLDISTAYRLEARNLALLSPGSGAVPLLWTIEPHDGDDEWIVLGFPYVAGHPPRRPWRPAELQLVTDRLAEVAPALVVPPPALPLEPFVAASDDEIDTWNRDIVRRDGQSLWLDEVLTLTAESVRRCSGTAVTHADLRDDNLLLGDDGTVWICDWNWPMLGAPWLDLVTVLIAAHGDGIDVDRILETHPLTTDVDPRSINAWLSALWCYFTTVKQRDFVPSSPHLRDHQAWYEEATGDWISRRIGLTRTTR